MRLSVTVPVHNEETNIRPFVARITPVLDSLEGIEGWEVLFVNNGSADGTLHEILAVRQADSRVKVLTLARNFGYHAALVAGLSHGTGDLFSVIDVDCEDPPELLTDFYGAIRGGAQVAYGIRSNREEPALLTLCRKAFYRLNQWIADSEIVLWMAEFCMITRQVRDNILAPKTTFPFLRAEIGYVGFKRVGFSYRRAMRQRGKSHYHLLRMVTFAVGGLLSSSTFPLRLISYLAVAVALLYPAAAVLLRLSLDQAVKLAVILGFYFLLTSVPILALYLARAYKNGVARPVFVADKDQSFL